jgi:hypothetical protein
VDTADRRLGRAALIVTALLILMVAVTAAIALRPRGEVEIPAEWRSHSDYTLIIFGRTSCPACEASASFHRELAAAAETHGVRVVAASTGSMENADAFAVSIGVKPEHSVRAVPAPQHLNSVPAIVVVDRGGRILQKAEGALAPDRQRDWMRFVSALR